MKRLLLIFIVHSLYVASSPAQQYVSKPKLLKSQIPRLAVRIKILLNQKPSPDSISLKLIPVVEVGQAEVVVKNSKVMDGVAFWKIPVDEPFHVYTNFSRTTPNISFLAEAGDNITITVNEGNLSYSGPGSAKLILKAKLEKVKDSLDFMIGNKLRSSVKSLKDYLEWNNYFRERIKLSIPIIESFKNRISKLAYTEIRNRILDRVADDRSDKFGAFLAFARKEGFSNGKICQIFDTTYAANMGSDNLPSLSGDFFGSWRFAQFKVLRQFGFNWKNFPLSSEKASTILFYKAGCAAYVGTALEKFKVDFLTKQVIHDLGFVAETDSLLNAYYKEPGYKVYKEYVKNYEIQARKLKSGQEAPNFILTTNRGRELRKQELKGKVLLMDFWFTGCIGCIQMTPALRKLEEHFKNDSNVVFLSVSTDKNHDQWLNSVKAGKYTTGTAVNLYTGGLGASHPIIKDFQVGGYPSLYLIDAQGNVVVNPVPDPRGGKEDELIALIEKQLVLLNDGPYVFEDDKGIKAYQLNGDRVEQTQSVNRPLTLKVATDQYQKSFDLQLQTKKQSEPAEFPPIEKLIAFSDIEGNFDALRKLLQSNSVINNAMEWTFGKGHLVFAGDMFDRGQQVTECLWLIYSLEEKAKTAGGVVHFVLGNHELMNLSGNERYVKQKYIDNARLIGKSYVDLYRENSELGRWLRTKNIIEKVGPLLFTHGGISPEFINLGLPLKQVNELARPYYANDSTARKSSDINLSTIFSTKKGPFWYRDYYLDAPRKIYSSGDTVYKTPTETVDRTLAFYGVKHIVTGHSIVDPGEHVSVHYGNKVINTDTEHAKGKSEALLVEGNNYYRVNDKGQRWLLFKDE